MLVNHREPIVARLTGLLMLAGSLALLLCAAEKAPAPGFEKDVRAFEAADQTNPPPKNAILFIGASSTRLWKTLAQDFPDHRVLNRGFGGSQMSDVLQFADRIAIPYRPKLIVVQAGGNDIHAGKAPEQVLADFKAFVTKVRATLPQVRIAFASLNPAPSRWAEAEQQQKANQLIRDYVAGGDNLDYIDLWGAFLGPEGQPRAELFVADRLHNNAAGYKIRADLTRPHLGPPEKEK
jgi:lysophospholipase L1-like esterase